MNYLKLLQDGFSAQLPAMTKLEFLSSEIFDFATYDSNMDELFASKAIEVCEAITEGSTFEYIENRENHKWYLIMCNIPFFSSRIEWGISIRGAWWTNSKYYSCGLYDGDEQITDEIEFTCEEWEKFIQAIIEFSKEQP